MPGLSLIYNFNEDLRDKENDILLSFDRMLHFNNYKKYILRKDKAFFLGYTSYEGYPLTTFENDHYLIYFEGQIYGKDYNLINTEIKELSNILFDPVVYAQNNIAQWLLNNDGNYIVLILCKKTDEIVIINDVLGRLPIYYTKKNGKLIISREIDFVLSVSNNDEFDRMAIAQYLLLGYSLGNRIIFNNVFRMNPASIMKIKLEYFEVNSIFSFNFDAEMHKNKTIHNNVDELLLLFNNACKNMTQNGFSKNFKNILSLSGGLDSRAVGSCFKNNNIPFYGITYLDYGQTATIDIQIAKQISDVLDIDWRLINLDPPRGKDFLKLLHIKDGLNYLGMSFILSFFSKIIQYYGHEIVYFTGDGGQLLKPEFRAFKRLNNFDELIDYILSAHSVFPILDVAKFTQIPQNEIIDEIKNHISLYPENNLNKKYIHFLLYEENVNYCFEGEDRNRFYFWSLTPFYSIPFMIYVLNCPDHQISKYKLYRDFLLKLSPQISKINNADWGLPLSSSKINILFLYHKLPSIFKIIIRRTLNKNTTLTSSDTKLILCLKEELNNCRFIDQYLSNIDIDNLRNTYSQYQLNFLFTITSSIENITSKGSSIEKYYEAEFI